MQRSVTDLGQIASRRNLRFDFPINADARFEQLVASPHPEGSDEFRAQFDAYAAAYENDYKSSDSWLINDHERDAVWEIRPESGNYMITVSFTIRNAAVQIVKTAEATVEPGSPEFDAWLNSQADQALAEWFQERGNLTPVA